MQIGDIEKLTKTYADAYSVLAGVVSELNDKIEQLKRDYLPAIRRAVRSAAERKSQLSGAIEGSPELFIKPRTYVFHGVKVGIRRDAGGIDWENEQDVIRLIKKHFPDKAGEIIRTVEKVSKTALQSLPATDLKRLGVQVIPASDTVVIVPADTNVDKIVSALLKDADALAADREQAA